MEANGNEESRLGREWKGGKGEEREVGLEEEGEEEEEEGERVGERSCIYLPYSSLSKAPSHLKKKK